MTAKRKARSRILEAVHETAVDLHRLGIIDMRTPQRFDSLCLMPIQRCDHRGDSDAARARQSERDDDLCDR